MTKLSSFYRGTYFQHPYEGKIDIAELSLRFDYSWTEEMHLDVMIACEALTQTLHDITHDVKPSLLLDSLILPAGTPLDRDFRKLDQLEFELHQPTDTDGERLFELDAPGNIYFGQWLQIDDLSMRLQYLGNAEFYITLSGIAEGNEFEVQTAARLVDASMLHRGTAAKALDMDIVVDSSIIESACNAGQRWIDLPQSSERALAAFARRLNIHDYAITTRVDANDTNVDMIGRPIELRGQKPW